MNIEFANENVFKRYVDCEWKSQGMENSLAKCFTRLLHWFPHDSTAVIHCDFDDLSFFFRERRKDGSDGMCGGIIYHGARDNGGDGSGPTFSVNLSPTDGYAIHT